MKKIIPTLKEDWIVGTWQYDAAVSPVTFTIKRNTRGFQIQAIDESDGEELIISKVKWDGKILTFETLTPSNKWRTKNCLRVISKTQAIHEFTFWETWSKKPTKVHKMPAK